MTTLAGINEFGKAYRGMATGMADLGIAMPENRAAGKRDPDVILRRLDNAVFTFIHHIRANTEPPLPPFQAVRGAFPQGAEMAPKSGFRKGTHVQIALRDPACAEGWFLPKGQRLLSDQQYSNAIARRDAMAFKRKPRKRP